MAAAALQNLGAVLSFDKAVDLPDNWAEQLLESAADQKTSVLQLADEMLETLRDDDLTFALTTIETRANRLELIAAPALGNSAAAVPVEIVRTLLPEGFSRSRAGFIASAMKVIAKNCITFFQQVERFVDASLADNYQPDEADVAAVKASLDIGVALTLEMGNFTNSVALNDDDAKSHAVKAAELSAELAAVFDKTESALRTVVSEARLAASQKKSGFSILSKVAGGALLTTVLSYVAGAVYQIWNVARLEQVIYDGYAKANEKVKDVQVITGISIYSSREEFMEKASTFERRFVGGLIEYTVETPGFFFMTTKTVQERIDPTFPTERRGFRDQLLGAARIYLLPYSSTAGYAIMFLLLIFVASVYSKQLRQALQAGARTTRNWTNRIIDKATELSTVTAGDDNKADEENSGERAPAHSRTPPRARRRATPTRVAVENNDDRSSEQIPKLATRSRTPPRKSRRDIPVSRTRRIRR